MLSFNYFMSFRIDFCVWLIGFACVLVLGIEFGLMCCVLALLGALGKSDIVKILVKRPIEIVSNYYLLIDQLLT